MYIYSVIVLCQFMIGHIKCHDSRNDNTSNFNQTIERTLNNSGTVRNKFPFYDHALNSSYVQPPQKLNTSLLPPVRESYRASEEKENEKPKVSHKHRNFENGGHSTTSSESVNDSNQTVHHDVRNNDNKDRYIPTTDAPAIHSDLTAALNHSNVSTHRRENAHISSASRSVNHRPKKLCEFCACTKEETEIICEHNHISQDHPHTLIVSADIIPKNATSIRFKDFESLHIEPGTFTDKMLKLVNLEIINIPDMILENNSLSFNSRTEEENMEIKVKFENCSFTDIKSGAINQIGITNHRESNEFKLHDVRMLSLHFNRCKFKAIRSKAIANIRINSFDISFSEIEMMENASIDIDVYEDFKINNNNITTFVTNSINIRSTHTVLFSHNTIGEVQTQAFRIKSESQVKFAHNNIRVLNKVAFTEIRPWNNEEAASIILLGNTILKAEPLSFLLNKNYPAHERIVKDNRFKILCSCNVTDPFQAFLGINENSTHIQNATLQTLLDGSLCQDTELHSRYINIKEYIDTNCTALSLAVIISASIAGFLLLVIIVVVIVCQIRVKRAKEEANYLGEVYSTRSYSTTRTESQALTSSYEKPSMFSQQFVVPDVKTYHQTEVHFPYENAEPMSASIRDSCLGQDTVVDYNTLQQNRVSCPFN